jgi:hypothetical protein
MKDEMDTVKTAGAESVMASVLARYGNRYYPVDPSYDKRVYENTAGNWVKICVFLGLFWLFNAMHWWGIFELGIARSEILTTYSLSVFAFTLVFGAILLISGKYANYKKRMHMFLSEKIALLKADELDKAEREKQDKAYKAKIAAKEAEKAAAAEIAAAKTVEGVSTNIQDGGIELADVKLIKTDQ